MYAGKNNRYEKYSQYLRIYGLSYFFFRHSYVSHNAEFTLVLIAFGYLLIVNNKNRRKNEHNTQNDTKEE